MVQPDLGWGGDSDTPFWMDNIQGPSAVFDPIQKEEACLRWTVAGVQGSTVSTARLAVPKGARKDFESACSALKGKKLPQAEVQARDACSHALSTDANYVPAYLCMADVTYGEGNWDDVLEYSTRALALDPVHDAYGYFYSAAALYNKGDLARAEDAATQAIQIDKLHRVPEVVFLLAKINQARGDMSAAVAELHEYLKLAPASQDSELAKKNLSDLDGAVKR
jgi:tetratricopeptide (TPR) repeat protein